MRLSVVLFGTLALAISASADQIDFVWSPTDFQTIPTPTGQIAFFPTHINDAGVVAGGTNPGTIVTTWSSQGGFEDHPIPAGYRFGYSGTVSNTGVVLGGFSSNG